MPGPNFRPVEPSTDLARIGIGVIGYGWIGHTHSVALNRLVSSAATLEAVPRLVAICGRNEDATHSAAKRLGYEGYYTDWQDLIQDDDIQVVIVGAQAYLHAEASIASLQAGKHVLCEKPLAPAAEEAHKMLRAASSSKLTHATGFNYRFVPALRLARNLIKSGTLGRIHLFRAHYLNEFRRDPLQPAFGSAPEVRGRGALNDIGSHIIDLARFLVGEVEAVSGKTITHIPSRPSPTEPGALEGVPQEDTFHCLAEFSSGATGILEGAAIATGRKNHLALEVNGTDGSIRFNLERLNELEVYLLDQQHPSALGFRDVIVTEADHPFAKRWWHKGHILGWEDTVFHEIEHFINCVAKGKQVSPDGATFSDGYEAALVAEAIRSSSSDARRIEVGCLR